jgi:hypothetical protein
VKVPIGKLYDNSSIAQIAQFINSPENEEKIDLIRELECDLSMLDNLKELEVPTQVNNVFLTGASGKFPIDDAQAEGFLGVYLLNEILQMTSCSVYCLVRYYSQGNNLTVSEPKIMSRP